MPRDLVQRVNLDLLHPGFLETLLELLAACRKAGTDYFVISGYRSFAEQDALYAKGRTAPGKKVTNAKGGFSAHQYGIAADLCKDADKDRAGLQPDWDLEDYELLAAEAAKLGLESGMTWKSFKEGPHVQLRLPVGVTYQQLKDLYEIGGLEASWKLLPVS